jgi:hypothetical protein
MIETATTDLDREAIRWARATPAAEKLIAGARLFDYACTIMIAGIRRQHPDASDEQVLEIVRESLEWASRWE